ncbi:MAG: host attachment protein [Rhodoferax sp.]|nr:host attachment protein [Rhodoferax sp.]
MPTTWILIADAQRARCFERVGATLSPQERADFVAPQRRLPHGRPPDQALADDRKGHGRRAHAGTQFEPQTSEHERERARFAGELADHLNQGIAQGRCDRLALIATAPMLGALRERLSPAATQRLGRTVALDLTHYDGPELQRRIQQALLTHP